MLCSMIGYTLNNNKRKYMTITKQSLFNTFKTLNDNKSKISFLIKMKNLKSSTDKLNHLNINFDNLIKLYS
jgi:hypothetical protein